MSTVTFAPESHTYAIDGAPVPSVTKILCDCYDFSRINPDVLAAKAALGEAVHLACELDDADDLDEASVHGSVRPYLEAYRLFKSHVHSNTLATELVVHHPLHRYAGRLDLLTEFNGDPWLIDWKTPLSINPAVGLQTIAYQHALPETYQGRPWRRGALQLKNDGTYKLHEFKDPNDWPVFLSFLAVFRWKQRSPK